MTSTLPHSGPPASEDAHRQPAAFDDDLASSLTALSHLVMRDSELAGTLTHIADFATRAIPGADGAGLTLFQDDRPDTVVATAPFVREADALQYDIGEGPCITATAERRTVRSGSLGRDAAFPRFGARVVKLGLHSMLSLPLVNADKVLGSINVYAHEQDAFDDRAAELGELFAAPAAVSVQSAQSLSEVYRVVTRLQLAMSNGKAALRATDAADDVDGTVDGLLSRVSHELRTPLNAILGFAQLLELDSLSASQRETVEQIVGGGRQLLKTINNVFDIAPHDFAGLHLTAEHVLVTDLLDDAIKTVHPFAAGREIAISVHDSEAVAQLRVSADPDRVKQVLLNLLSNAVEYNRPGGRVDITFSVPGNDQVALAVTDTGTGIAAADLAQLFSPTDRIDQDTDTGGTGIGLALSQHLVALMGGHLDVESRLGEGSTFTLTMPLAAAPAVEPAPSRGTAVTTSSLLYIEDNPTNVRLMRGILDRAPGWTMEHAGLGMQGLELAERNHPDLIMLDLHLPDVDGIDVVHALQANPHTSDIPVIIVSADALPRHMRLLTDAGADRYLTKPVQVSEVLDVLGVRVAPTVPALGAVPPEPPWVVRDAPPTTKTVLYIEDDSANIRLVDRILGLRGDVTLHSATTGEQGLTAVRDADPDLVLLDRGLPDMRGDEVLRRLKASPDTADIPVVVISGDVGGDEIAESLRLGAAVYLRKPIDMDELLHTVELYCGRALEPR
jgi:signal transduction histidine kinase/CheY-like chemotaxis protein